jgi:hypothetical protein
LTPNLNAAADSQQCDGRCCAAANQADCCFASALSQRLASRRTFFGAVPPRLTRLPRHRIGQGASFEQSNQIGATSHRDVLTIVDRLAGNGVAE